MALATNAFPTYSAIGNREDLSDTIYRIDPSDTPFYSSIERERATATKHEWQTQALAAANPNNAAFEGDDNATPDAVVATTRLANYLQIQTKIPRVTGTQDVVLHAGRGSEMDYQVMLKGLELKRDVEATLLSNTAGVAGAVGTPRKLASVLSWLVTNTSFNPTGGGANPTAADGTSLRTDGTQRAFTEALLKTVLQSIWQNGGKPDTILLGAFNKQVFSSFTGRGTPIQDQAEKTITAGVDLYQSDFGNLKAVPERFLRLDGASRPGRDVIILQTDLWAMAALNGRNFISFQLAKTGDTERRELLVEHTLVARNEKGSGGVFDLTTV
jgi:hypothetical protein